jgi:hypothetical protein
LFIKRKKNTAYKYGRIEWDSDGSSLFSVANHNEPGFLHTTHVLWGLKIPRKPKGEIVRKHPFNYNCGCNNQQILLPSLAKQSAAHGRVCYAFKAPDLFFHS